MKVTYARNTEFVAILVQKDTKEQFIKRIAEETLKGNKMTHDQLLKQLMEKV